MQKTLFKLGVIFTLIALFSLPQQGNAFGIGVYIPALGLGSGTYTSVDSDDECDFDTEQAGGIGIVLDTRVARDGLFNYRLNLGYYSGSVTISEDDGQGTLHGFKYFVMDHSFGFGIVRTRLFRLWAGPQVRLAYMAYSDSDDWGELTQNAVGFGLAPVIGANFNFGRVFTVALDLGYRISSYAGTEEYTYYEYGYYDDESEAFTMSQNTFFINLSVLFRIGDVFEGVFDDADDDKPDYDEEYY